MVLTVVYHHYAVAREGYQNLRIALSIFVPSLGQLYTLFPSLTPVSRPFLSGLKRDWYVFASWVGPAGLDVFFPYDSWVHQPIWKADCKIGKHPVLGKNASNKVERLRRFGKQLFEWLFLRVECQRLHISSLFVARASCTIALGVRFSIYVGFLSKTLLVKCVCSLRLFLYIYIFPLYSLYWC